MSACFAPWLVAPGLDEDGETAETGDTLAVLVAETRGAPVLTEEEEERRCLTETRSRLPPTWELRDAAMEGERRDCAREETEDEEEERLRESSEREALEVAAIAMAAVLMLSVLTGTGVGQRALWLGQAARTAQVSVLPHFLSAWNLGLGFKLFTSIWSRPIPAHPISRGYT